MGAYTWVQWLDEIFEVDTNECQIFPGCKNSKGYGVIRKKGYNLAHRYILEKKLERPIAPGMETLHSCDVPGCINKFHLSEGSRFDNIHDCINKGRFVFLDKKYSFVGGTYHPQSKLTEEQVLTIRAECGAGDSQKIADKYGVTQSNISFIMARKTWTHI